MRCKVWDARHTALYKMQVDVHSLVEICTDIDFSPLL